MLGGADPAVPTPPPIPHLTHERREERELLDSTSTTKSRERASFSACLQHGGADRMERAQAHPVDRRRAGQRPDSHLELLRRAA